MNTLSLKQIELVNLINHIDDKALEGILTYAKKNNLIPDKMERKNLAGIWANSNFDNIDVEQEIRTLRKKLSKNLDKKII